MDETGARIISDAAAGQRPRRADFSSAALDANIDRLAIEMQAVDRDTFGGMQHRVGLRSAISGNDLERLLGANRCWMPDQQIEQRGIDRLHFVRAPVAQDEIDASARRECICHWRSRSS